MSNARNTLIDMSNEADKSPKRFVVDVLREHGSVKATAEALGVTSKCVHGWKRRFNIRPTYELQTKNPSNKSA